jgi:hypothetical protein
VPGGGGAGGYNYTADTNGGGGRIAIVYGVSEDARVAFMVTNTQFVRSMTEIKTYLGTTNVVAGTNVNLAAFGQPGTIVFFKFKPPPGAIFILR